MTAAHRLPPLLTAAAAAISLLGYDNAALAGEHLQKKDLLAFYRQKCEAKIRTLVDELRTNHVKIEGTGEDASKYRLLPCDYQRDPLYKTLQDDKKISSTERRVKEVGVKAFITATDDDLAVTYEKYKLPQAYLKVKSGRLTEDDLKLLIAFARTAAKSESVKDAVSEYLKRSQK